MTVADIQAAEMKKLIRRSYMIDFVIAILAFIVIFCYSFFFTKCYHNADHYYDEIDDYDSEIYRPLVRLQWIGFTVLAILFFTVGCIMLNRLRVYFKGFFKDYGCYLWVANILLTIPLTIRATFDALLFDDDWLEYWFSGDYKLALYNLTFLTLANYMPMLLQISSLIFGFVR